MSKFHERTFPGESEAYRAARNELLQAEIDLRQRTEQVAALRRKLPVGAAVSQDYVFDEIDISASSVKEVRLSELFDDGKDTLIVYGFMYGPEWEAPCSSCTSITDSSNGIAPHVRARTNFVVVAKAPAEKLMALGTARGWKNIRFLSSFRSTFNADYLAQFQGKWGEHHPLINVFVRRETEIHHFWASEMLFAPCEGHPRHADLVWPLWNWLDMTPEGRGDFMPKLDYNP